MRMIMGLDRPTSGTATVNDKPYRQPPRAATPVVTVVEEAPSIKVDARGISGLTELAPRAA
jgi:ABC-type multidrug transport system ATPase subunit